MKFLILCILCVLFSSCASRNYQRSPSSDRDSLPLLDVPPGARNDKNINAMSALRKDSESEKLFWVIPGFEKYSYCSDANGNLDVEINKDKVILNLCSNLDEHLENLRNVLKDEGIEFDELRVIPHTRRFEGLMGALGQGKCVEKSQTKVECTLTPSKLKKFFNDLFSGNYGYDAAIWAMRMYITIEGLSPKGTVDNLQVDERFYGYGWAFRPPNVSRKSNPEVDPEKFLGF